MLDFPFLVAVKNGKCCISYAVAENAMLKPSEVKEMIPLFEQYINEHTDEEIEAENKRRLAEFHESFEVSAEEKTTRYMNGYIYLFECGGKYKVGISRNVERRVKDLDKRPFKVNLIAKVHSDIAYKVEQEVHNRLKRYKIEGEWYDFPIVPSKDWFESFVRRVEDDTRRNL